MTRSSYLALGLILSVSLTGYAQSNSTNTTAYFSDLNIALQDMGLGTLAETISRVNETVSGKLIIDSLPHGFWTVMAPDTEAFSSVPEGVSNDTSLLADILSYHFISGNFTSLADSGNITLLNANCPNATLGRTLLNSTSLVELEANKSQVVAWCAMESQIAIINQKMNTTISNTTLFSNLLINTIPSVLALPANLSTTLSNPNLNLSSLLGFLNQTAFYFDSNTNTTTRNVSALEALSGQRGLTIFAPSDTGFVNSASSLTPLATNATALTVLALNHVINGTSVYSPSTIPGESFVSAAGQPITFSSNSSGLYIHSGGTNDGGAVDATAKIIQQDIFFSNGVIHIIDRVLYNDGADYARASSAYADATSSAQSTLETGPVGIPTPKPSEAGSDNGAEGIIQRMAENRNVLITVLAGVAIWAAIGVCIV